MNVSGIRLRRNPRHCQHIVSIAVTPVVSNCHELTLNSGVSLMRGRVFPATSDAQWKRFASRICRMIPENQVSFENFFCL
jgi:hypothetical protein